MPGRLVKIGLVWIIALCTVLFAGITSKANGEVDLCNHERWTYHSAVLPYLDNDGWQIDGRIAYYYCPDCGKYAADQNFVDILSAEEVMDYYVLDKVIVKLGGDTLKLSDLAGTPSGIESVSFVGVDFSKYKYIMSHSNTGTLIKTTTNVKLYRNTLKDIKIKVVTKCADPNRKVKYVNVHFELPEPKVKVSKKWSNGRCTFYFKYNIKGASKIKVRIINGKNNKEIKNKAANKIFDKYMKKNKSDKESYIWFSKAYLKKYNNKVKFKITAYYGKKTVSTIVG